MMCVVLEFSFLSQLSSRLPSRVHVGRSAAIPRLAVGPCSRRRFPASPSAATLCQRRGALGAAGNLCGGSAAYQLWRGVHLARRVREHVVWIDALLDNALTLTGARVALHLNALSEYDAFDLERWAAMERVVLSQERVAVSRNTGSLQCAHAASRRLRLQASNMAWVRPGMDAEVTRRPSYPTGQRGRQPARIRAAVPIDSCACKRTAGVSNGAVLDSYAQAPMPEARSFGCRSGSSTRRRTTRRPRRRGRRWRCAAPRTAIIASAAKSSTAFAQTAGRTLASRGWSATCRTRSPSTSSASPSASVFGLRAYSREL